MPVRWEFKSIQRPSGFESNKGATQCYADADTVADAEPNSDAGTHEYRYANSDGCTYTSAARYTYTYADGYAYTSADRHAHVDRYGHAESDTHTCTVTVIDSSAYCHLDTD